VREHDFAPGARVFSDRVNELLAGNVSTEIADVPAESVMSVVRDRVLAGPYAPDDLPSLSKLFDDFAARIGTASDWGKVPLSVPEDNQPFLMPLRVAYERRAKVDRLLRSPPRDPAGRLRVAALALGEVLIEVSGVIDHKVALLLAFETLNGMAKTAPMTDKAMRYVAEQGGAAARKPWWRFW
jgi:hypothetical protein